MRPPNPYFVGALIAVAIIGLTLPPYPPEAQVNCSAGQCGQSRQMLLGSLKGANFNSTADQSITINSTRYAIRRVTITNASTSLTLAVGGFYAAASKTTPVVAATQVYTGLTGSSKYVDLTLGAILTTDIRTEATLFFSLTTAQGSSATADIFIFGDDLS